MTDLLPIGAYVLVTDPRTGGLEPFYARIVGYDVDRTKYYVGGRFEAPDEVVRFYNGGLWVYRSWCVEVAEAEATNPLAVAW